jgi:hypothetical protein
MSSTVVGGGEHSEKFPSRKSFDAIHHTLMSSKNEISSIILEELMYAVRPELHNIASAVWISDNVRLDSTFQVRISWI